MSGSDGKPGWGPMGGETVGQPAFVSRQVENLERLKALAEGVVLQKQREVEILQEKLARLKHGGGF